MAQTASLSCVHHLNLDPNDSGFTTAKGTSIYRG